MTEETKTETKPVEKKFVVLNPMRMKLAEYERQDWVVTAEIGTTVEDILETHYWTHMASQMKPYDRIEVRIDDGLWLAELLVLMTGRNWAKVHLIARHNLTTKEVSITQADKYEVKWQGPHFKFCVIRKADSETVAKEFADKDKAYEWMRRHEQSVG